MDISTLYSFYTAAKFKSISKAAEYLNISQPGMSIQIQGLENELGIKLLTRSNKGVELTAEGRLAYEYARDITELSEKFREEIKALQQSVKKLDICACESICSNVIYECIYNFKKIRPDINISLEISSFHKITKKLLEHDANMAIFIEHKIPDRIEAFPIMSDRLVLVCSEDGGKNKITLEELKRLPLILRQEGSGVRALLKDSLKNKNMSIDEFNIIIDLDSYDMQKSAALAGKGYTFIQEASIAQELKSGLLKKISVEDFDIPFNYCIAMRNGYCPVEAEKAFLNFFLSNKSQTQNNI